jgi:hypothetical protein
MTSSTCLHVVTLRTAGRDSLATNLAKMYTNSSNRLKKIVADKIVADKKLAINRANAKTSFEEKLVKLESTAGLTNVQKQAIETYKTDMELATVTRETAVDKARTDYSNALESTVLSQQTALTNAAVTYQTAFEKAFAVATSSCSKGVNMSAVKTAVQTAHQDLKTAISKLKTSDQIKQLATTRNDAIKTATNTFSKQAATFTQTLKTALGE